jgi:hypothetical protein
MIIANATSAAIEDFYRCRSFAIAGLPCSSAVEWCYQADRE